MQMPKERQPVETDTAANTCNKSSIRVSLIELTNTEWDYIVNQSRWDLNSIFL